MRCSYASSLLVALCLLPASLQAQERWGFDLRAGGAAATAELGDADLSIGFGFEGTLMVRTMEHLFVYAGWDWHAFSSDESFAGPDIDFEETGYAFGVLFEHPLKNGDLPAIQLRAGATVNHIEVEDDDGEILADSGHGVGWEVGAGLAVPFGDSWRLTPGFRFRTLSRDLEIGSTTTAVDLSYIAFEIGFSRLF